MHSPQISAAVSLTTRSPSLKPRTARPSLRDRAAELVAEHDRHVHRPGVRVPRLVHVGAADRHRADRAAARRRRRSPGRRPRAARRRQARARSERRRTFSWQQSGVPGARRARAGVEVYRMDVVGRSSAARGTDSSPPDGTPRRRSRAARRARRAARRATGTRSPGGSTGRRPPAPGIDTARTTASISSSGLSP